MTLFDKIKECISMNNIVFDGTIHGKNHYLISDDMRKLINNTFSKLSSISDEGYIDYFDQKKYYEKDDVEELAYGPVIYTVHHKDGYPEGYIHEIKAKDVTYYLVPKSEYIVARGSYNNFYTESHDYYISGLRPHTETNDIVLITDYYICYTKDGKVNSITTGVRLMEKERNGTRVLKDTGYKKYEFETIEEFFEFKEKVKDYEFAKKLFTDEKQKAM